MVESDFWGTGLAQEEGDSRASITNTSLEFVRMLKHMWLQF